VGYLYRSGSSANSAVLGTVGFDALVAPPVTVAVDVLSQFPTGTSDVPPPVEYIDGSVVRRTTIPDKRDNLVGGSAGVKISLPAGFTAVGNAIVPFTHGGVRSTVTWTAGLEKNF
jgi:hypothetical protein